MSTFWLIYWVTFGVIVFFTAIIGIFFEVDGENVSISYIVLVDFLGAIPVANVLVALGLIYMIMSGIFDGDLDPKY